MKQLFAVIRTRGGAWQDSYTLESQQDWTAHAAFMDALEKDDFVVLGGPLPCGRGSEHPRSTRQHTCPTTLTGAR